MKQSMVALITTILRILSILVFVELILFTQVCLIYGMEMGVKCNSEFKISLASNPTTGYKWQVNFNREYVKLISDTFEKSSDGQVGSGGTQIFVFLPIKEGKTKIEFVYQRPWEKEPIQKKGFHITIGN